MDDAFNPFQFNAMLITKPSRRDLLNNFFQHACLDLTLGTQPALVAKKALAGTTIPVVFAPVINPVGEGIVASLMRPGGNATGVQDGDTLPKALEWLHKIAPHATQVHVLYHLIRAAPVPTRF
jgi:ABC-type uncharacterized transport system substrate-binding protein